MKLNSQVGLKYHDGSYTSTPLINRYSISAEALAKFRRSQKLKIEAKTRERQRLLLKN